MIRLHFRCFLSALSLCAAFSNGRAQTSAPPQPAAVIANVNEVMLDITVRDKKGRPVNNLTPGEITVTDNGVKQTIRGFRLVSGSEAISAAGSRSHLDPLRQIRLVTLAFEALGEADQRQTARKAALDLVEGQQAPNVLYSVVMINTRLLVLQPFTSDKQALARAIEQATAGVAVNKLASESDSIKDEIRRNLNGESVNGNASPDNAVAAATQVAGQTDTSAGPPGDPTRQMVMRVMLDMLRMDSSSATQDARMSLLALKSLVVGLWQMPGRKSVLYFSNGLYFTSELDKLFSDLKNFANRANVTFYSLDARGVMLNSQNSGAADALAAANNAAGTSVQRIGGAVTKDEMNASENAENSSRANVQLPIRDLAESTGGFLISDSNDLRGPLRRINEEINSYYELTYDPQIPVFDGALRKVTVTTGRKDLVIHSRTGYFALAPEVRSAALETFEAPLLKAISDGTVSHDVEFRAGAVLLRPKPSGTGVLLLVEVPLRGLQPEAAQSGDNRSVHFSLAALIEDAKGTVIEKVTRDRSLKVTAGQLQMGHFVEKAAFSLAPGAYTLESAVMDQETHKLGTHHAAFRVPQPGAALAISSLSAVRAFTPNAKGLEPEDHFQFQGGSITPTLENRIPGGPNSAIRMFFTVYSDPANAAKPAVEIDLLEGGRTLGKTDLPLPAADAEGKIPYVMTIPAAALPAGNYVIRALATQGAEAAETRAAVTVVAN